MIYIFTLAIMIILVIRFDYKYVGKNRIDFDSLALTRYDRWYRIMLMWFICVSGFAYNVGADIPNYMQEYNSYSGIWKNYSFSSLFEYDNRNPGWVILNVISFAISDNFVLLKLVIAIFVNWSVFRFFKRHTKYVFTGITFYAVILYLSLNFNALRQAVAVGFFLIGYDYLLEKKWIKYYLLAFLSFMFHTSGIICFLIPLFNLIKFNSKGLVLFAGILITGAIFILQSDVLQNLAETFILSGYGGDNINELGARYMSKAYDNVGVLNIFGIMMVIFNACIIICVILFNIRKGNESSSMISLMIGYAIFYVISFSIPIIFERALYFFYPFYICGIAKTVIEFPKMFNGIRALLTVVVLCFFCYAPIRNLFAINASSGIPLINQFAPYYSVFNPKIDPVRAAYFGYWTDK